MKTHELLFDATNEIRNTLTDDEFQRLVNLVGASRFALLRRLVVSTVHDASNPLTQLLRRNELRDWVRQSAPHIRMISVLDSIADRIDTQFLGNDHDSLVEEWIATELADTMATLTGLSNSDKIVLGCCQAIMTYMGLASRLANKVRP